MAELMKLLETNGAFKSDLMQNFLSSAQMNRDTSLSGGSLPMIAAPAQLSSYLHSDVNLNISPSLLSSSASTTQSCSPFPSLPETSAVDNLNGNKTFTHLASENVNGNSVFVSNTQSVNDNLPSPRIMSLDNMNKNAPSNLNVLNKNNLTSPGSRSNANINNNNSTSNINVGATADSMENMNINANAASLRQGTNAIQKKLESAGPKLTIPDTNANNAIDVTHILAEVNERLSDSRQLLIDQVTGAIADAHMNTTINTYANVAAASERLQKEANENPDANNGSNLWQHFMGAMVPEITKVIAFCTKLPGFPEVAQEDKICLIKQGCFEVMVARFCMLIDHTKEEMLDPTLKMKAPRSAVKEMPMGPFLDQFFTVAGQFNPLSLTDEEIGLFTAVLMICPERQGLKNQAAINVLQKLFLQALYLLLKQNHRDAEETLTSLMNLLPVFHKINEDHLKFIKMIKMKSPADYEKKFPTLHKELFDTC